MSLSLPLALANAAVWRADALARPAGAVVGTGYGVLDAQLPGGGWPVGGLVEVLQAPFAHNEWRLLLPALRHAARPGTVALVGAPHVPFGPGLAGQGLAPDRLLRVDTPVPQARLWATEQALRCTGMAAVLAWLPQARAEQLQRLQMAAASHAQLLFVMRPAPTHRQASPAVLRLQVALVMVTDSAGRLQSALQVDLFKRRGPPLAQPLVLPLGPARLVALLAAGRCPTAGGRPTAAPSKEAGDALDRLAAAA